MIRPLPLLVSILLLVSGCAAKQHLAADKQFDEATSNFRGGALQLAIDQFRELLDQYPFSEYNEEAELRAAHAQYLNESYPEAVVALADFQRRHPTSPRVLNRNTHRNARPANRPGTARGTSTL